MGVANPKNGLSIRTMSLSDLPAVMAIEREAFPVPWSENIYRDELINPGLSCMLVAEASDPTRRIVGYACYALVADEIHITNLAVDRRHRRRGIGERLLHHIFEKSVSQGAVRATLEVRLSNEPARNLYAKLGFAPAAIRKGYYPDNREDALVMWAELSPVEGKWARLR